MAESTKTYDVTYLRNEVTFDVYGGTGAYSGLTADEKTVVDHIVRSGVNLFYNPPAIGGRQHQWSFLTTIGTISINATYSTGTITYTHTGGSSERMVTLASGTWPSWAASGMIEISGSDYPVDVRVSNTVITLDSASNPGANVAAGTKYALHQDDYDLPDNFGRVLGDFTYSQADNAWFPAQVVGERFIRALRMKSTYTTQSGSDPYFAAIVQKNRESNYTTGTIFYDHTGGANERMVTLTSGTWPTWAASAKIKISGTSYAVSTRESDTVLTLGSGSNPGADVAAGTSYTLHHTSGGRQVVMFEPPPVSAATVTYRYRIVPEDLSDTNEFPYGATQHDETILAACKSEVELRMERIRGPYWEQFIALLSASIERDGLDNKPQFLGVNTDRSDTGTTRLMRHDDYMFSTDVKHTTN